MGRRSTSSNPPLTTVSWFIFCTCPAVGIGEDGGELPSQVPLLCGDTCDICRPWAAQIRSGEHDDGSCGRADGKEKPKRAAVSDEIRRQSPVVYLPSDQEPTVVLTSVRASMISSRLRTTRGLKAELP
jgi:hypothetical protein